MSHYGGSWPIGTQVLLALLQRKAEYFVVLSSDLLGCVTGTGDLSRSETKTVVPNTKH
jgi:hypothetical protein